MRDVRFSTAVANAKVAAVTGMLDGGWVLVYDGERPASAAQDPDPRCALLARLQFGVPAFEPPARGRAEARPFRPCVGEVFGTPTWFRASTARGEAAFDGTVGPRAGGVGDAPREDWAREVQFDMYVDGDVHEGGEVAVESFAYVEDLRS